MRCGAFTKQISDVLREGYGVTETPRRKTFVIRTFPTTNRPLNNLKMFRLDSGNIISKTDLFGAKGSSGVLCPKCRNQG